MSDPALTLMQVIERLQQADPSFICRHGFGYASSYRGHYRDLAFAPKDNVSVGDMLREAKNANGHVYKGYRGGTFLMTPETPVHLAYPHEADGDHTLSAQKLEKMLQTPADRKVSVPPLLNRNQYDPPLNQLHQTIENHLPIIKEAIENFNYPDELIQLRSDLESSLYNLEEFLGLPHKESI